MSKVFWSTDQYYNFWANEASDDDILEEFLAEEGIDEEDLKDNFDDFSEYLYFDNEDNITGYDYYQMRQYILEHGQSCWYNYAWDNLTYGILPDIYKQLKEQDEYGKLIIDGETIDGNCDKLMSDCVATKIQDRYGNAEINEDDDGNLIDWYTIPKDERKRYVLARHVQEVRDEVRDILDDRENPENAEFYEEWGYEYGGAEGKDLWLKVLNNWIETADEEYLFEGLEEYLVPIHNPYKR